MNANNQPPAVDNNNEMMMGLLIILTITIMNRQLMYNEAEILVYRCHCSLQRVIILAASTNNNNIDVEPTNPQPSNIANKNGNDESSIDGAVRVNDTQ